MTCRRLNLLTWVGILAGCGVFWALVVWLLIAWLT